MAVHTTFDWSAYQMLEVSLRNGRELRIEINCETGKIIVRDITGPEAKELASFLVEAEAK